MSEDWAASMRPKRSNLWLFQLYHGYVWQYEMARDEPLHSWLCGFLPAALPPWLHLNSWDIYHDHGSHRDLCIYFRSWRASSGRTWRKSCWRHLVLHVSRWLLSIMISWATSWRNYHDFVKLREMVCSSKFHVVKIQTFTFAPAWSTARAPAIHELHIWPRLTLMTSAIIHENQNQHSRNCTTLYETRFWNELDEINWHLVPMFDHIYSGWKEISVCKFLNSTLGNIFFMKIWQ